MLNTEGQYIKESKTSAGNANYRLFLRSRPGIWRRGKPTKKQKRGLTDIKPLQPEYHLPLYIELRTFDHRATLTALEKNLGRRKVTTHSRGWTLKSIQETTKGDQEVFGYQLLRQRSKTATFQKHLIQFRPCAQMTYGETRSPLCHS